MKKKVVLSVKTHGDEEKRKVQQAVTSFLGIDSIQTDTDTDGRKLTVAVVGTMDETDLVNKLRKYWITYMIKMSLVPVESLRKQMEKQNAAVVGLRGRKADDGVRKK